MPIAKYTTKINFFLAQHDIRDSFIVFCQGSVNSKEISGIKTTN